MCDYRNYLSENLDLNLNLGSNWRNECENLYQPLQILLMSLPPELRVLCIHLSSTPVAELPRLTPILLRQVLRCHVPLSSPTGNSSKADASASAVLVHKLKTQLSTLLNGKSPEGRFTAVVLIKAVVEVGGWEVLRSAESWVRGLLSILVVAFSSPVIVSI